MASTKPTLIFIHGAFHRSSCYDKVKQRLEALSYPVIALNSRTTNGSSPMLSYKDDVEEIHQVMLPLLDAGKEVVIVGHSYGGIPAYVSTEGQSIMERAAAGKNGGVRSIVFICAFAMPMIGMFLNEVNNPSDVSWVQLNEEGYVICNEGAKEVLYGDLPDEEKEVWFERLEYQSPGAFVTPVHFSTAELKVPSMYLLTEKDRGIFPDVQEKVIAALPNVKVAKLPCGHSPFLSHPDETVDVIVKGAELR